MREIWTDHELDEALARLRSEVPPPDAGTLAAIRVRVLARAGEPARATTTTGRVPAVKAVTRRLRRAPGWWLASAAAVVAVVTAVLLVPTVQFGARPAASAEAVAVLDQAAAATIGAVDEPVGPGRYHYIATRAWWSSGTQLPSGKRYTFLAENLLETWVPADQRQQWLLDRQLTGRRQWLQGDEASARADGVVVEGGWPTGQWRALCGDFFAEQSGEQPCTRPGDWQRPTPEFLASLPRDPQQLFERLGADAPDNSRGDAELLVYAADALRSGLVPADLRAALYQALRKLPGLSVTDQAANLDGRRGVALGMDDGRQRQEIIVDPRTGEFIGERNVVTRDSEGLKAGTVLGFTSVSTAVVDTMGARPGR